MTTVANTFGALEIGSAVSVFLFGVVTLQTHIYFQHFPEDRRYFKALVGGIWLLELGHTITVSYEVYRTTIILYGTTNADLPHPALGAVIILGTYIATLTQIFFCHRLHTILPSPFRLVGPATALIAAVRCVLVTYTGAIAITASSYASFVARMHTWVLALLALGAAIDVAIAAAMVGFLLTTRERSPARTARVVDRLIAFTLRTGLITSVVAITVTIIYKIMPYNLIFLAVYTSLSKLYTSSLISGFNTRISLRNTRSPTHSVDILHRTDGAARFAFTTSTNAIAVEMKTTTQFHADDAPLPRVVRLAQCESGTEAGDDMFGLEGGKC